MELHPEHHVPGGVPVPLVVALQLRIVRKEKHQHVNRTSPSGLSVSVVIKPHQDVSLEEQAGLDRDADTRAAVSLHIAATITITVCEKTMIPHYQLCKCIQKTHDTLDWNKSVRTIFPTCRRVASPGRSSGKDGSLRKGKQKKKNRSLKDVEREPASSEGGGGGAYLLWTQRWGCRA